MKTLRSLLTCICILASTASLTASAQEQTLTYEQVEVKPVFLGNSKHDFPKWIRDNIDFSKFNDDCFQGRVVLSFTVLADGSITDIHITRGLFDRLDKEVKETASRSPKWEPGKQNGKPVNVIYSMPVIFQLR